MDVTRAHIRRQVLTALTRTIEEGSSALGEEEMVTVLHELLADLDGENSRICTFSAEGGRPVLTLEYGSAVALEREWDILTEICGMLVEVNPAPPKMKDLTVLIAGKGLRDRVELYGRVVQNTKKGAALELFPPDIEQKRELKRLLKKMEIAKETLNQESSASMMPGPPPRGAQPHRPQSQPSADPAQQQPALRQRQVGLIEETVVEEQWEVNPTNISTILLQAAGIEGYGVLEFKTLQGRTQLVVHHGALVDIRKERPADSETLESLLLSAKKVTAEEIQRAQEMKAEQGISLGEALVDLQTMTHEDLLLAVRTRLIFLLHQTWKFERGEAKLFRLQRRPEQRLRSSAKLLAEIVSFLNERYGSLPLAELKERQDQFRGSLLKRIDPMPVNIAEMGLDPAVERFVSVLLADSWSLEELHRVSSLSQGKTIQTLLVLDELDLLERKKKSKRRWEETQIEDLHLRLRSSNYFELFGVHWSAYEKEIDEGYDKLTAKLDVPQEVQKNVGDKIEELRREIEEAYMVLSNRRSRRTYRDETIEKFAQKSAIQIYSKKADTFRMQGNVDALVDCLKRILELDPGDKAARRDLIALRELSE